MASYLQQAMDCVQEIKHCLESNNTLFGSLDSISNLLGIVFTSVIAIACALFRLVRRRKNKTRKGSSNSLTALQTEIREKLDTQLLGTLPRADFKPRYLGSYELPLSPTLPHDKEDRFYEAISSLTTTICMSGTEEARKIIMVTSSVMDEGKSTVSMNLAYRLAQREHVLLIDCDMRRPVLAKASNLAKSTIGLSSLITGTHPARDCIYRNVLDGYVDLIPSGPQPDEPAHLFASLRFEKILEQLGKRYDRIVIDSASVAVSDALELSRHCSSVVYVMVEENSSLELAKAGLQKLRQINASIAGVVINKSKI